jgi:hypothetical protein
MTDQRDPEAFPRSTAYRAQASVKVSAAALLLAYGHLHVLELRCEHIPPIASERGGYLLYRHRLVPAATQRLWPSPPGVVITRNGVFELLDSCLADSVQRVRAALQTPWDHIPWAMDFRDPPAAWMHPDDLATVDWLEETLRRLSTGGGPLLQAARGAHDQALHKPRRKRAPVELGWLYEQVTTTLDRVWFALLHARLRDSEGALWLHQLLDEAKRPVWSFDQQRG